MYGREHRCSSEDPGFRLEVFRGRPGLEALAADWRILFEALPKPHYAQLWDWYRAFLEGTAIAPDDVYFGALYDGDTTVAILPLDLQAKTVMGQLGVTVASLPRPDPGFHGDFLLHPQAQKRFDLLGTLEAFSSACFQSMGSDATRAYA